MRVPIRQRDTGVRFANSIGAVVLVALLGPAPVAAGELQSGFSFLGAGELWFHPELGGHGIGLVAFDLKGLPRSAHFSIVLNTDTLTVHYDRVRFAGGRIEIGAEVSGEARFAGLLPDYYRDNRLDSARGFWASYLKAQVYAKLNLPKNNFVSLKGDARRWFFSRSDDTDNALILPAEAWVFEPRLSYTLWHIKPDKSLWERHRLFSRIRGIALGVILGADFRSQVHPWGARDSAVFNPIDPRNDPSQIIPIAYQWLKVGWQMHDQVRTQISQATIWGAGGDDLTRVRVGGLNPYVVPIAGAPWAAHLSEVVVSLDWSWHIRVGQTLETGVLFNGAFIEDKNRVGNSNTLDPIAGIGLFVDWPLGHWQIDGRAGWSPSFEGAGKAGSFAALVSLGFTR